MSTTSNDTQQFEFTGKHMLGLMLAFFGVIIAVNLTMATLASKSWTGLVVKNSYVASQQFNRDLEAAKAQNALGLYSKLSYWNGHLNVEILDKAGNAIPVSNLKAEIGRPAFEQQDSVIAFMPGRDGGHTIPVTLGPGVWAITVIGETPDSTYRRDARIFVNESGMGRLE